MTDKEAYEAMFYFLRQIYDRAKSDELGGLLSDMSLLPDGLPADPAVGVDWERAVEHALSGAVTSRMTLTQ